jgi:hypothetical protein
MKVEGPEGMDDERKPERFLLLTFLPLIFEAGTSYLALVRDTEAFLLYN